MDYAAIYDRLMERAKVRSILGYSERHHVVPRCLGGGDEPENIVLLTPEEHYVAHQLLVKIRPEDCKLLYAAIMMSANPGQRSNKTYGWLRRRLSEEMSRNNPNAGGHSRREFIARTGSAPSGWTGRVTAEGRARLSAQKTANNPMRGIKPWDHPQATEQSLKVWADALQYYNWWRETGKSYHRMARDFGYSKPTMAHHNLINYFRNNWIPENDLDWKAFLDKTNCSKSHSPGE